ncbi:LuxR C-terminal-related transcriptional regulator [Streptomyces sp. NPDC087300]|uniref:LuxR C-terminal-related transcriptional regulator n=1 Tax=Streptomyces sp. NPDC087300 TaxID=3365780 RepID=UPI0037FF9CBA
MSACDPVDTSHGLQPLEPLADQDLPPYELTVAIRHAVIQLGDSADQLASDAKPLPEDAEPTTDDTGLRAPQAPRAACSLSRRELGVALLIAQGHTNQRISRTLGISLNTVKNHNKKILAKLGLRSRTEVAIAVHRVPGQCRGNRNGDA